MNTLPQTSSNPWYLALQYEEEAFSLQTEGLPYPQYSFLKLLQRLLRKDYEFWLIKSSLSDSTHQLLIVNKAIWIRFEVENQDSTYKHLQPLKTGFDGFVQENNRSA